MMKEPAGLESSVGNTERLCREVRDLLAKARSMLAFAISPLLNRPVLTVVDV
jgi:hypothetical protein